MDRGVWQDTVHGVARVGRDSVTKPPPPALEVSAFSFSKNLKFSLLHPMLLESREGNQLPETSLGQCIEYLQTAFHAQDSALKVHLKQP